MVFLQKSTALQMQRLILLMLSNLHEVRDTRGEGSHAV